MRRLWPYLRLLVGAGIVAALLVRLGSDAVVQGFRGIGAGAVLAALGIGLLTPPVGSTLFIGSAISGIKIETLSKKMVPFYMTMSIALLILTYFPQSFMWLPNMLY